MKRTFLKGKIHRAVVTAADLDYEGSLGLDENLMQAADLRPDERVEVDNVTNGERFSTYLVKAAAGSGAVVGTRVTGTVRTAPSTGVRVTV